MTLTLGYRNEQVIYEDDAGEWGRFESNLAALVENVQRVVVAERETIRFSLLALFTESHVLLEDLPGVGKTLLAKTIARSIEGKFTRIQFTPDLLPTDITGSSVFDLNSNRFEFLPGPIFANIVLADELNRAGPRTQSALLEAMGERQVSADGSMLSLPKPFLVIATQNFAESHGTFPLPYSQLDRFTISMGIGYPDADQEIDILNRSEHGLPEIGAVLTTEDVIDMQATVRSVQVALPVKEYIVNVLRASREHTAVSIGVSPRGGTYLQRTAQAWAAFEGRSFVVLDDVKRVAPNVLRHRVILGAGQRTTPDEVIADVLANVAVPL